jgi:hypothetical protein
MSAQPSSTSPAAQALFAREQQGLYRVAHALTGSGTSAALCVRVARAALPRMAATSSQLPLQLRELVARTALELAPESPPPRRTGTPCEPGDVEALTQALALVHERLRITQRALLRLRNALLATEP